jgi:hypothetical protein
MNKCFVQGRTADGFDVYLARCGQWVVTEQLAIVWSNWKEAAFELAQANVTDSSVTIVSVQFTSVFG